MTATTAAPVRSALAGIGLGLRREFAEELARSAAVVDWIEVVPENWLGYGGRTGRALTACAARWPVALHSLSLSVAGPDPLDDEFVAAVGAFARTLRARAWSDHLCCSRLGEDFLHDLLPVPTTAATAARVAARVRAVVRRAPVPFLLENITHYAPAPGGTLDDAAFLCAVLAQSRCGLLLDLNNVYVNSLNFGFDPRDFLARVPLERVGQIHLAGHTRRGDVVFDTHVGPICAEVWALYRETLCRAGRLIPTLVEWDHELPALSVLLAEVDRARAHAARALAGAP
jgi:uncharacterized protein (UPF0276 family)